MSTDSPTVSAIVIFHNEARFLEEAVESVLSQTFGDWELLLCDDGSTDDSTEIAKDYSLRYPGKIRYLEHNDHLNRGMSATRNLGLRNARGHYISWLDGDDVWTPRKLERQVLLARENPSASMVVGPLLVWYSWTGRPEDFRRDFFQDFGDLSDRVVQAPDLLLTFLRDERRTPSGLLIHRRVLEEIGGYDESFSGMHEDGVVLSKICLTDPVYVSRECWYKYRQHSESCCSKSVAAGEDRRALLNYLRWLESYLTKLEPREGQVLPLVRELIESNSGIRGVVSHRLPHIAKQLKKNADDILPSSAKRWLGLRLFGKRHKPPSGWLHPGNLHRVQPISSVFGLDRGLPVDRYYIERFLLEYSADIRGRVLEVGEPRYTLQFGDDAVRHSDVLHATPGNPYATLVGDLCTGDAIPEEAYDCIILTQVIPFLWDVPAALGNVFKALKPGGTLLITAPGISQISRYDADRWGDFWRFTSFSMRRLLEASYAPSCLTVCAFGNVLAATAFLHGIAAEELEESELDFRDADYEVLVAARATKSILPLHGHE